MNKKPYDNWVVNRINYERCWWLNAVPIIGWLVLIFEISFMYPIMYVWGCESGKQKRKQSSYDKFVCKWLKGTCGWHISTIPIFGWIISIIEFGFIFPCLYMFGERK